MKRDYRGHPRAVIDRWFPDHLDLARYDPKLYYFDPDAAERVLRFFTLCCSHWEGELAGKPLVPEDWQFRMLRDAFGWKQRKDGFRKYRLIWLDVARKNGKTTVAAGIGLYLLVADNEAGSKVFSAATDKEQAGLVFDTAAEMVQANRELRDRIQIFKGQQKRSMYASASASVWRVLSGVPKKSGLNPHGIIFDEVHEQPNRKLWDVLHTGTGSRTQPMTIGATTAGFDETTICYELHSLAIKVQNGTVDIPTMLPVVFAADDSTNPNTGKPKDNWKSEKTWAKANPNLGISVKLDYLRAECKKAQATPAYQNTFKRFHLNMWTRQNELWMPKDTWDRCGRPFPMEPLRGHVCFGGIDLSSVQDLSAFARVWPICDPNTGIYHFFLKLRFWLPKAGIAQKEDRDMVPYGLWAEQGFLELTEGDLVDYDFIRKRINEDGEFSPIQEIAIDRWNATQITTQLAGDGFTMVPFGQGFVSMAGPTRQLMETTIARTLHHGANPLLDWNMSNMAVRTDPAGNWKPDKEASKKRIDGGVATIMALGRASLHLDGGESVYESRGVLVL